MKRKITFIFEINLSCVMTFFALYGMICFVKTIAEISADKNKTEKIPYNINYRKYNINHDNVHGLLVISGNGTVSKEIIDEFENVEVIFVCKSISGVEPNAFRDVERLKILVMPYAAYSDNMTLPIQTDLFYIDDGEYREFIDPYF